MKNIKSTINSFVDDYGVVSKEVHILPYGGGGNIIVSRASYNKEMQFRKERNKEVFSPYDVPSWESLEVYRAE